MRALRCHQAGGPEVLRLEDLSDPEPGPGEVLIDVRACGLNFADTLMLRGRYQDMPDLPFTPGLEVAGTVAALGANVDGPTPGARVLAVLDHGGFADRAVARAVDCFAIPDEMTFETAAGFPIAYGTAHAGLAWRAGLKTGETVLIHGAAGGVGLTAVEVAKALGATVIATAGGPEKLAVAEAHGADHLINSRAEDIRERVKALTGGVDVVYDPVGGPLMEASLRCVNWGARIVVVGFAAGDIPQIPANILLVKHCAAIGLYWGSYRKHAPERLAEEFTTLFAWYRRGLLRPHVSRTLPLADGAKALDLLIQRKSTGKVVLTMERSEAT